MLPRGAYRSGPTGSLALWAFFALGAVSLLGCNPYERRQGEFYAGAVDPAKFPRAYLGAGGVANRAGSGTFDPVAAHARGREVFYYSLPLPDGQAGLDDPLLLGEELTLSEVSVFDPRADAPFPERPRCRVPEGYGFDQQRDAFRQDEQGNIFQILPSDPAYVPVVQQVPVTSRGLTCQDAKTDKTLRERDDVTVGQPSGKYLAWPIIDPAADVISPFDMPDADGNLPKEAALGPQRLGWRDHYLLAYLDGGYVPTRADAMGVHLLPQRLYYPKRMPLEEMGVVRLVPGEPGAGFDVLEAARGGAGYSPICQLFTYEPADPMQPETDAAQIDQMTVEAEGSFIYCLQLQ